MNLEIPVRDGVDLPPLLAAFGPVRPDPITPAQSAEARKTVGRIVAKVGFER
jgi:iron(III) transport system substrate-binding protein